MKKNYVLFALVIALCFALQNTNAQFIFADDNASNGYTSPLNNGTNGGSGFFPWDIKAGENTGAFIGNPSNNSMGTTNIGTTAWGFYSNGGAYINAQRYFDNVGMEVGDEFTFEWAMNFDAGGGNKGFDFKKDGGNTVFNINNGGTAVIDGENGNIDDNYGTTPMSVTLKRISSSDYSFSMTSRSGGATYSSTYTSTETVKGINIYSGNQNNNDARKNIYFNNFLLQNSGAFDIIGGSETYTIDLTGSTAVSKSGIGTLILSGDNTYNGATTVSNGTLVLNSSLSNSDVTVKSGATLQISDNVTIKSLTVDADGIVTIIDNKSLTITNNLTNNGSPISINFGNSLIVNGSSTGNITYNLTINDENWHLISSPAVGQQFNDTWIGDNFIDNTNNSEGTSNVGIATYDNSVNSNDNWIYVQDGGSGTFNTGQGYSIKRDATDTDIEFTGTLKNDDTTIDITPNDIGGSNENRWTLIGNPYPSYIDIDALLSLTENETALENSREAIYIWDGSSYPPVTDGYIHPGQGFFVSADIASAVIKVNKDMLSHQTGVTFYKSSNSNASINLMVTKGGSSKSTKINYISDKTTGLDPRYDLGTFNGGSNSSFNIFTHLVSDSNGVNFMRQALPEDYETLVVPIGIVAEAGKQLIFSAEAMNLPTGLKVFLEDRANNTFNRLDEANSTYTITLDESLNDIGRFYLHTTASALNTNKIDLENVSVYTTNASNLRVVGINQEKVNVKLFNMLGKQVFSKDFESNGVSDLNISSLTKGFYIVQVNSEKGILNKKIILE